MKLGDTPINNVWLIDLQQDNEHATAGGRYLDCRGMTLRQYYAGLAMQGIMANPDCSPTSDIHFINIAEDAVRQADALLAELEKEQKK